VTGALLVSPKGFAQVLEGSSGAVSETFERIQCDLRHDDLTVLSVEATPERQFDEWAVASCDGAEVLSEAGISLTELADRAPARPSRPLRCCMARWRHRTGAADV
jgi:hypothetical protein